MRPLKSKELIPEAAQLTQLPEYVVKDIITYYWENIRKNLSSLKHPRVHITNLGDFTFKYWKVDERIASLERFEENNRQKGLQQMTARFRTAETLYELGQMKKQLEEEKQRKEFIKLHKRSAYETDGQHPDNMEE